MPKTKETPSKKTALKVPSVDFLKKIKIPKIEIPSTFKPVVKILGMVFLIIGSLALIDLAVQYLNNDYSVAVVDGSRISKGEWHDRLEKTYGSAIANQLIEEEIIKAEAKDMDVSVSTEDIDTEISRIIESIGGQEMFDSALVANNITLSELRDQIEMDLLSTAILSPSLEYTDDDVKSFFDQYSDVIFPQETADLEEGEKLDYDKYADETEDIFIQQEVQNTKSTWLAEKKTEYKIQDNTTGKPKYGFLTITTNIFNGLFDKADTAEEVTE